MTYINLTIQPTNAVLVRKGLEDLDAEVVQVGRVGLFRAAQRIVKAMRREPSVPTYPPAWVNWDNDRQKRAFFKTKGFGTGVPHVRSHDYSKGYHIDKVDTGYQIYNDDPSAKYVGGDSFGNLYSKIHLGIWPLFADAADKEISKLPEEIQNVLTRVVNERNEE